jgi:hypothetical protein
MKTKWIGYYLGISAILTLLAAVIFRSHLNFTALSFIPMLEAGEMVWMSLRCDALMDFYFKKYDKDSNSRGFYEADDSIHWRHREFLYDFGNNVFLIFLPLTFPLILFFEDAVKISAASTVMLLPHIAVLFLLARTAILLAKQSKAKKQAEEAARREQEKRESMGQWK